MLTATQHKAIWSNAPHPNSDYAFGSAYSTSRIRFEANYYAFNTEKKTKLIRWRCYLETTVNAYTTSAKQHAWTMQATSGSIDTRITQTGYTDLNTDIDDRKIIASGVFEMEYFSNDPTISFNFTLDTSDVIHVNMLDETGHSALPNSSKISVPSTFEGEYYYGEYSFGIVEAHNFNDEENLTIKTNSASKLFEGTFASNKYDLSTFISLDGYTNAIQRNNFLHLEKDMGEVSNISYTYNFTEDDRKTIRIDMANEPTQDIYIILENRTTNYIPRVENIRYYVKRTLSIVNANPVFNPVVKDTNATTLALTGDESVIVRYGSNAYVESNVELQKHAASIVNHSISVGGRYTTAQTHTFNAVEGNTFTFTATDSRGFNTTIDVKPPFVDYVKLTCNLDAQVVVADTGVLAFEISGNYFNNSFGAVNNNLGVSYRIREKDAAWGNWVNLSGATFNGNTYTVEGSVNGLNYQKTYEIQAMAIDRLNTITTPITILTTIPIFDWGKEDFNFNVPVNFSGSANFDKATTFNSTTAFENAATFNSNIVFNGNVDFGGNIITANNVNTATTTFDTDNLLADYIIETGQEAMGSNGVWKWQKWKSGKAEAWGKRNYGNMGISTTYYGSLYQSDTFEQELPSIFAEEPDVIDINIIKSNAGTGTGAFVLRGIDTNASASSTGSFAICKRNTGTLSQVYLGFHIVGKWN